MATAGLQPRGGASWGNNGEIVPSYDVTPDGQGFVMLRTTSGGSVDQLRFVLSWGVELERRVSAGR